MTSGHNLECKTTSIWSLVLSDSSVKTVSLGIRAILVDGYSRKITPTTEHVPLAFLDEF